MTDLKPTVKPTPFCTTNQKTLSKTEYKSIVPAKVSWIHSWVISQPDSQSVTGKTDSRSGYVG